MSLSFADQKELAIRSIQLGKIDEDYVRLCCPLLSERGIQRTISKTVRQSRVLFMALLANSLNVESGQRNVCSNMLGRLSQSSTQYAYNTIYEMALVE